MRFLVDEAPLDDGQHFVDPVGELVSAILNVHRRQTMRQILSVIISDTRHRLSFPAHPLPESSARLKLRFSAVDHCRKHPAISTFGAEPTVPSRQKPQCGRYCRR